MFNTILCPYLKINDSLMTYIHILKPYLNKPNWNQDIVISKK